MTTHDECMLHTAELELDLYGQIVSDSVLDHLQRRDRERWEYFARFTGTRALPEPGRWDRS